MSIIDPYIVSGYDPIGVYLDSHCSGLPLGADIDHRTYKLLSWTLYPSIASLMLAIASCLVRP